MDYTIEIASPPDRDNVMAEVWYGPDMIAEINQEETELAIRLYPTDAMLNLNEFLETLHKAARRLRGESAES